MTTEADTLLKETIEHIDAARKSLALITTDQVSGSNDFHATYQLRLTASFDLIRQAYVLLNNHSQEPNL